MNLTWKAKLAAVIACIAVVVGLLLVIKYQRDIITKQQTIQDSLVSLKRLPDNVTRAETKYTTTDDLDKLAKDLAIKIDPIRDDLKSLKADIKGIQVTTVVSTGEKSTNLPSDKTEKRTDPVLPNENLDPHNYLKSVQLLTLNEPFPDGKKVPFGSVEFSAWKEKPWNVDILPRKYTVINVLGQDEEGKVYTYSKFTVNSDGKDYDVKIDNSKLVEEIPQAKWRFSPRAFIGLDLGTMVSSPKLQFVPNLELMLFSFGKTKSYSDWEILGAGIGYESVYKNFEFIFTPVAYNVGQYVPFAKNIYIGPNIGLNFHGEFSILGGIQVGL